MFFNRQRKVTELIGSRKPSGLPAKRFTSILSNLFVNYLPHIMPTAQKSPSDNAIKAAVTPDSFGASGVKRDSQVLTKYNPTGMAVPRSSFIQGNGHNNLVKHNCKKGKGNKCFRYS